MPLGLRMKIFGKRQTPASSVAADRHAAGLAVERTEAAIRAGSDPAEVRQLLNDALTLVGKLAVSGDEWGQCRMGFLQKSFLHDFSEAARWYRKSAEQGNPEAQCKLGFLYRMGRGVHRDDEEAARLYRASAEAGYAEGQHNWAAMNMEGSRAVPQNLREAFRWFRAAADQGFDESQFNLGVIYFWGNEVVPQNLKEAERWLQLASKQGHAGATHNLEILDFAIGLGAKHIVRRPSTES